MITFVRQDYNLLIDLLTEADLRHNVTHNVASAFLNELQAFERSYVSEKKDLMFLVRVHLLIHLWKAQEDLLKLTILFLL